MLLVWGPYQGTADLNNNLGQFQDFEASGIMENKNETWTRKQAVYQKSVCRTVVQSALQTHEDALQWVICRQARNQVVLGWSLNEKAWWDFVLF